MKKILIILITVLVLAFLLITLVPSIGSSLNNFLFNRPKLACNADSDCEYKAVGCSALTCGATTACVNKDWKPICPIPYLKSFCVDKMLAPWARLCGCEKNKCEHINPSENPDRALQLCASLNYSDECYNAVAMALGNQSICEKISKPDWKHNCLANLEG